MIYNDSGVPYESGHYHRTERIGKKYQWIGLGEVYAYLLDTCHLKKDRWAQNVKYRTVNYPWLVSNRIYFDPTLRENDTLNDIVKGLFEELPKDSTLEQKRDKWIEEENAMPPFEPILIDREGNEWVVLQGYDTRKEDEDSGVARERFLYYNTCFVGKDKLQVFREWSQTANFYGRWMPESTGSIDYLWNDYPWASAYKESIYEDGYIDSKIPCNVEVTYEAELQEDYRGITNEEKISSNVYAPSSDLMDKLELYTAERGIIRKKSDDEIIAITRSILGERFHGFLIKRSALNAYLLKSEKCMFYCLLGEKNLISSPHYQILVRHELTGAALYNTNGEADMFQPLRHEPKEEPQEVSDIEDEDGLKKSIKKWLEIPKKECTEDFEQLKNLAELAKQENNREK